MYEHKTQPLALKSQYHKRILKNCLWAGVIMIIMLIIGTTGFYFSSVNRVSIPLIDAFHNSSMILAGMGPVLTVELSDSGKIFSSIYAIFCGVIFIAAIGFILTPIVHRFFHKFHLEER